MGQDRSHYEKPRGLGPEPEPGAPETARATLRADLAREANRLTMQTANAPIDWAAQGGPGRRKPEKITIASAARASRIAARTRT